MVSRVYLIFNRSVQKISGTSGLIPLVLICNLPFNWTQDRIIFRSNHSFFFKTWRKPGANFVRLRLRFRLRKSFWGSQPQPIAIKQNESESESEHSRSVFVGPAVTFLGLFSISYTKVLHLLDSEFVFYCFTIGRDRALQEKFSIDKFNHFRGDFDMMAHLRIIISSST